MADADLLTRYNYDEFVPAKFEPWLRFDESPPLGNAGEKSHPIPPVACLRP